MSARLLSSMILASFFVSTLSASDWPQFRGPNGNATSYDAQTPVTWDDTKRESDWISASTVVLLGLDDISNQDFSGQDLSN